MNDRYLNKKQPFWFWLTNMRVIRKSPYSFLKIDRTARQRLKPPNKYVIVERMNSTNKENIGGLQICVALVHFNVYDRNYKDFGPKQNNEGQSHVGQNARPGT